MLFLNIKCGISYESFSKILFLINRTTLALGISILNGTLKTYVTYKKRIHRTTVLRITLCGVHKVLSLKFEPTKLSVEENSEVTILTTKSSVESVRVYCT